MKNDQTIIHGRGLLMYKSNANSINYKIMDGWFFIPGLSPCMNDGKNLAFYGISID